MNRDAGTFGRLVEFVNRLDAAHVSYTLGHTRPESVMVDIALPGWRWEVEFMLDGSVEIERYRSVAGVEVDPNCLRTCLQTRISISAQRHESTSAKATSCR
jgi:hypothetical protein